MSQMTINLNTLYENTINSESEKKTLRSGSELAEYLTEKINNNSDSMSDEEKEKMRARIEAKLKSGKKLTYEEEQFLKKTDPQLYMQYKRIRVMADNMASQLKHAKTKQQANDIITTSMSSVSDKDPYQEYVLAAMNEVAKEFKKSPGYNRLPDKDSDLNQKKKAAAERDDSEDEFDPMAWTPLQEIIDSMPTFHASA
jgi:SET domain-containing protein